LEVLELADTKGDLEEDEEDKNEDKEVSHGLIAILSALSDP
jgi:hypothetical protein